MAAITYNTARVTSRGAAHVPPTPAAVKTAQGLRDVALTGMSTAQALSFLLDVNINTADPSDTSQLDTIMTALRGNSAGFRAMLPDSLLDTSCDISDTTTSASQAMHSLLERCPAISSDAQCSAAKMTRAN